MQQENLNAEDLKIKASDSYQIALEKALAEIDLMKQQSAKFYAESEKLKTENKYYPLVIGAAFATALITFTKLVL